MSGFDLQFSLAMRIGIYQEQVSVGFDIKYVQDKVQVEELHERHVKIHAYRDGLKKNKFFGDMWVLWRMFQVVQGKNRKNPLHELDV